MPGQSLVFGQPFGAVVGTRQSAVIQNWVGPYPPPDAIERYEQIMPGTFNRILSMAERMEAAQIAQSSEAIRYQANDTRRAHYLGAGLGAFAIGGAMVIGFKGQPWLAAVFLAVPVMGLARAFVEGWRGAAVATSAANTPSTDAKPDAPKPGS